ncbi:MAG: signal peptidase II [Deltaproteobacteria bacterium]|nr:signal peptidase II [Deltaproteobacteria bacterium]
MTRPILLALLVAAADQASKWWTVGNLPLFEPRAVVPGWIDLVHVRNPGVAFSLLSGLDPRWVQPLLILATLAAVGALVAYLYFLSGNGTARLGLGLVLGGALGNLIDRARLGYVVDFIDLHWRNLHWPTFNVADIGITVGAALLVADMIFGNRENDAPRPAADRKH